MSPLYLMGVGNCRVIVICVLGYSYSSHPTGLESISVPPLLLWGFYLALVSARLCLTFDSLGMPIITWCDELDSLTSKIERHQSWRPGKKNFISFHLQKWFRHRESKWVQNLTWCAGLLNSSGVTVYGSYVL